MFKAGPGDAADRGVGACGGFSAVTRAVNAWVAHAAALACYEPEARASGSPGRCTRLRFVLL